MPPPTVTVAAEPKATSAASANPTADCGIIRRKIKRPDGTKVVEEVVKGGTSAPVETATTADAPVRVEVREVPKLVNAPPPDWRLGAGPSINVHGQVGATVEVDRRLFGNLYLGLRATGIGTPTPGGAAVLSLTF